MPGADDDFPNEKAGDISMRKFLFAFTLMLCLLGCAVAGAQTLTFTDISATCEISDSDYIILTPDNLSRHPEWVAGQGTTEEALLADWSARGVLAQAWTKSADVCLEITAVQDEAARQYFDLDQQTAAERAAYRTQHLKGAAYKAQGYTYSSAEWKKMSNCGRFLQLKYKRTADGTTYQGYARRAIRNGYTITLDYQVFGRSLKAADSNELTDILKTWRFIKVMDKPLDVAPKVEFSAKPPVETNTGSFTVSGTCGAGMTLTGVLMRMSSPEPMVLEATAGKTGKFSMDVTLPEEGVWLMTMTVENQGAVTEEIVFDTTTYQKSLLSVNFSDGMPIDFTVNDVSELYEDKLVISGTTLRNVKVQCLVGDAYKKSVTTNASGKFSFSIDSSAEGEYPVTLVFEKKGYGTRRFTATASRTLTEEDRQNQIREEAVKPAYSTLTNKIKGYTGRTMVYSLYVLSLEENDGQWLIKMAMTQSKSGKYSNIVYVTTTEEPNFSVDSQQRMYGKCLGMLEVDGKDYPAFELLFWDN